MSTRANIILKDNFDTLYFYRHSDGYPEGAMPVLQKFMDWLNADKIRDSAMQSGGWLILLGAMEYNNIPESGKKNSDFKLPELISDPKDWKVGSIEPTTDIHDDIQYLYVIDMEKKELKCFDSWDSDGYGKHEVSIEYMAK